METSTKTAADMNDFAKPVWGVFGGNADKSQRVLINLRPVTRLEAGQIAFNAAFNYPHVWIERSNIEGQSNPQHEAMEGGLTPNILMQSVVSIGTTKGK